MTNKPKFLLLLTMIKVNKLISVFLGLVMIIAFFGKGIALEEFEIEIKTMLIPFLSAITGVPSERQAIIKEVGMFILPLVLLILLIESLIGLFLLFEVQVRASALSLVLLLLTFTLVLIVNILYPSSELKTCGCFGDLWEEPITWWSVGRNVVLIGMAWIVYRSEASRK